MSGHGENVEASSLIQMYVTVGRDTLMYHLTTVLTVSEGRKEGRKDGRKEGRAEGRNDGRKEGRKEGREEGRKDRIPPTPFRILGKHVRLFTLCYLSLSGSFYVRKGWQ